MENMQTLVAHSKALQNEELVDNQDKLSIYTLTDKNKRTAVYSDVFAGVFLVFAVSWGTIILFFSIAPTLLAFAGVKTLATMLLLGTSVSLACLIPIYAYLRVRQACDHLINNRKQAKAIINLTTIGVAILIGGIIGYFFLPGVALANTLASSLLIQVATGMMAGELFVRLTNTMNPLAGVFLGASIVLLLASSTFLLAHTIPFIPITLQAITLGAMGVAAVASFVAKLTLQIYYSYRYGNSNADGYHFQHSTTLEPTEKDTQQAKVLGVKTENVTFLRVNILNIISRLKAHPTPAGQDKLTFKVLFNALTQTKNRNSFISLLNTSYIALTPNDKEIESVRNTTLREAYHQKGMTLFISKFRQEDQKTVATQLQHLMEPFLNKRNS